MPGFILRRPWTQQPQEVVRLSGFLGRPEFVFLGGHAVDIGSGVAWSGSVPVEARGSGLAIISSSGGTVALSRTGGVTAAQTQCTFVLVYTPRSGSAVPQQFAGLSSGSSGFLLSSTGNSAISIGITKGNVTNLPQIALTAGVTYVVITSHDQVSGQYYIVARPINGGAEVRASTTSTTSSIAGNGTYRVGGGRADLASADADVFLCAASFVFEPESKLRALLDQPLQIFEDKRIWVPVSAGGGTNASVTLTGCSAASAAGATVALGSATAALSGASSASAAGAVAASAGASVTVVGSAASSAAGALTATAGGNAVATLTGASATSTAGSLTAGGSAGISLAGVGAAGAAGAVTATAGGAASVTLTGASASAAAGILAGFGGAQITLTGASASGAAGSASASAGSGSGTGATAAEIWSYTLSSGLTADATLVAIHTMLSELHLIHGLTAGSPLSVTVASRAAGAVSQAVAEAAGTVTVTRQ